MKQIVVIGAGAAGMAAATRARRRESSAALVVLEAGPEFARGTCSLPYYLCGEVPRTDLRGISAEELRERRIDLRLNSPVASLAPDRQTVRTLAGDEFHYSHLIVTTGSRPRPLVLHGCDASHSRFWQLRTVADVDKIRRQLPALSRPTVAIVGGGYVGLELAEALTRCNCRVTIFHRGSQFMRLRGYTHQRVLEVLQSRGIVAKLGCTVRSVTLEPAGCQVEFDEPTRTGVPCEAPFDAVCQANGVQPQAELLARAGARTGPRGGVLVDRRGQTSLQNVFAAGDGVELNLSPGDPPRFSPLATTAARLGRVCGENVTGGDALLGEVWGTISVRLFGQQVGVVGQPRDWDCGRPFEFSWGKPDATFATRQPGRGVLFVNPSNEQLLGGQLVGPNVAALIDVLSLAVENRMTLDRLGQQDYSYNPPLSGLWHPFYLAARQYERAKREGAIA